MGHHTSPMTTSFWHQNLASAVAATGSTNFFPLLVRALRSAVSFDRPQAWLYHRHLPPQLVFHDIATQYMGLEVDLYLEGPYREDPFFQISLSAPVADLYRLSELIEGRLEESSYYASYYQRIHVVDELMLLIPISEDQTLNICLMRSEGELRFSDEDIGWLRDAASLVIAIVKQHVSRDQFMEAHVADQNMANHINRTLSSFGTSIVTTREQEVLQLTLQGYSTAVAAERMNISVETLRRHRKNIYQKLDLSSQADLFTLFLNVLRCGGGEDNTDPLIAYLS